MAGARQPLAVVEAKGRKHLTRAEKEKRAAEEPALAAPKEGEGSKIRAPEWLPEALRPAFNDFRTQLVAAGIFSRLDRDVLGRYLVAQNQWLAATERVQAALNKGDVEEVRNWTGIQEKFFKAARNCAGDLGLTITSRCRLVIPEALRKQEDPEEEAFLTLLERRRRDA